MTTMDEKVDNIKLGESVHKIVTDYESKRKTFEYHDPPHEVYTNLRKKEKNQLQGYNDQLAAYLERLSHLQLQTGELTDLKEVWERDLKIIQDLYQKDITDTITWLQTSHDNTKTLQTKFKSLQDEMEDCQRRVRSAKERREDNKNRIDSLLVKISEIKGKLLFVGQNIKNLKEEADRWKHENGSLEDQIRKANEELAVLRRKADKYPHETENKMKLIREQLIAKYAPLVKKPSPVDVNDEGKCREIANATEEIRRKFKEWVQQNKIDADEFMRKIEIDKSYVNEITGYREESKQLRATLKKLEEKLLALENENAKINKDLLDLHFQLKKERRQYEESLSELKPRLQFYVSENISFHEKIKSLLDSNVCLREELERYKSLVQLGNDNLNESQNRR